MKTYQQGICLRQVNFDRNNYFIEKEIVQQYKNNDFTMYLYTYVKLMSTDGSVYVYDILCCTELSKCKQVHIYCSYKCRYCL